MYFFRRTHIKQICVRCISGIQENPLNGSAIVFPLNN